MSADDSDEQLVQRTLAGDSGAFSALVHRYRRPALARALAILVDPADADDVAQEAFVQAYEHLALCRDPSRFGAWLLTIVYRKALNAARTSRRRPTTALTDTLMSRDMDAPRRMETAELRRTLLDALAQLTPMQRQVVVFADVEDWDHGRIADTLGISVLMSRRHLSDARKQLRTILHPQAQ